MFLTKIKNMRSLMLVVGLTLGGIGLGVSLSTTPAVVAQQPGAKPDDDKQGDDKADWRVRVLDEQIARLQEQQKQTEQELTQLNKRSADIERTIGELRAQRERFLKKPATPAEKTSPKSAEKEPDKTDQERMVGNWFIMNDDSMRKGEMWVISADRILMHAKHGGANRHLYSHRLDSGKDPKQIDITVTRVNGPTIGVRKGLYALDGDELRLSLGEMGKDRPAAFPEKPKPGEVLVLQRATSGATPPTAKTEQPAQSDQELVLGHWIIVNDDSKRKGEPWQINKDKLYMHANVGGFYGGHFYRLDAGTTPKQIDIFHRQGGDPNGAAVNIIKGIYVLDSDETRLELRLCLADMDKDRPATFPEKPAPGQVLILHRQKPGAEQPKAKGEPADAKKVLTPEEAVKQMPKENVTVQFKVASVEVTGWYLGYPATYYVHLKDGGKFTAWLNAYHGINNEDQIQKLVKKLGIKSVTDLGGKVVRVTGRVDESGLRMWVHDPANNVEVVKPKTDGKEQKPNEEKQSLMKEEKLRALIDQVLAAHGGEDKLNKLMSFTMKVKHSNGETQHYFVQPPKNFRWETTHRDRTGKRIVILFPEGRRWWTKEPNEVAKEFIPTGAEPLSVEGWLDYVKFFGPRQVLRLKDDDHKVALLDEEVKIGDRAAVGVKVTGTHYHQTMYFDKETHLLLKGVGSDILREVTFSDYKEFDGIPIAQKEHDGHFEPEVTDFRAVDKFDARLFERP